VVERQLALDKARAGARKAAEGLSLPPMFAAQQQTWKPK